MVLSNSFLFARTTGVSRALSIAVATSNRKILIKKYNSALLKEICGPACRHAVFLRNDVLLTFAQQPIWHQDNIKELAPIHILFGRHFLRFIAFAVETTRQKKIRKPIVSVTIRSHMPSQAVIPECVRTDPHRHIGFGLFGFIDW